MQSVSRWRRRLAISVGVLVVGVLIAAGIGWRSLKASVPRVEGNEKVPGLHANVDIVRDRFGVPSISGASDLDATFALGFVHAQDRFYQMEVQRHFAEGTLSALVGGDALPIDKQMRTFGLHRAAERSLQSLNPHTRALLDAYAAGVNAWLAVHPAHRSIELDAIGWRFGEKAPRPWSAVDQVTQLKLLSLLLDGNYMVEMVRAQLLETVGAEATAEFLETEVKGTPPIVGHAEARPAILRFTPGGTESFHTEVGVEAALELGASLRAIIGAGIGVGSNSWVLAGTRTRSGKPILCNDPHLAVRSPSQWYAARIDGGDLHVAGMTMPGLPMVIIGRNQHIAWGLTAMAADVQDLFIETTPKGDPDHYLVGDRTIAFEKRTEMIEIAGAQPLPFEVRTSIHGPIIQPDWQKKGPLALRWIALAEDDTSVEALFAVGHAADWPSFREALRLVVAPVVNFTYADDAGHIGYVGPGRVPIRARGDGSVPSDGRMIEEPWPRFVPFDELPQALDPKEGYIASANQRVVDSDYPYFLGKDWAPAFRAIRIRELMEAQHDVTLDDMPALFGDVLSVEARLLRPLLLKAHAEGAAKDALALLQDWDARLRADSGAALLYEAWKRNLGSAIFVDDVGEPFLSSVSPAALIDVLTRDDAKYCDDRRTPTKESCADILSATLAKTSTELVGQFGPASSWRLDRAARVRFRSRELSGLPLVGGLFTRISPAWGDGSTVHAMTLGPDLTVVFMPSMLASYELGSGEARANVALGQSAHALSPHFDDLLSAWQKSSPVALTPPDPSGQVRLTLSPM